MSKKMSFLMILLVLAMTLAIPASSVSAGGAKTITFTAVSYSACGTDGVDWCGGDSQVMPNGEIKIVNYKDTLIFTATDDRWTATCLFSGDPFIIGKPNAWPLMGSFICTPTDPKYEGGWWEGNVREVFQNNKLVAHWSGKGYGTFDGLLVRAYNSMSNNFRDVPPGTTDAGVIIELPGYVPVK